MDWTCKLKSAPSAGRTARLSVRLFARALPPIISRFHSHLLRRSCARHKCTMVRLITHNLLACHAKGCTSNNFPLQFKDVQVELREAEFNPDFLRGFIPRLEWGALVDAARQVRSAPHRLSIAEAEQDGNYLLVGRYIAASRASGDDGR